MLVVSSVVLLWRVALIVAAFAWYTYSPAKDQEYSAAAQTYTHGLNFPKVEAQWLCGETALTESTARNFWQAWMCAWDGSHYLWLAEHGYDPVLARTTVHFEKGPLGVGFEIKRDKKPHADLWSALTDPNSADPKWSATGWENRVHISKFVRQNARTMMPAEARAVGGE